MADLDPCTNTDDRIDSLEELRPVKVGQGNQQITNMVGGLKPEMEGSCRRSFGATVTFLPGRQLICPTSIPH